MKTTLFDLNDRIALVTGASRGIGEEIARIFAQQGAHVIVSSRKIEDCKTVVDAIKADGGSAEAFACNVGKVEDISAIIDHIRSTHGKLDILVNNAAANTYFGSVLDTPLASFQKAIDVNIRGYFYMSAEAAKLMRENNKGTIINVGTIGALTPAPNAGIYCITKAAIVNMTKVFANECAEYGIRTNAILPGITRTKFSGALFEAEDYYSQAMQAIPMHRHAEPEEMAGTVLYLASDASSYTNGETILVDGGWSTYR